MSLAYPSDSSRRRLNLRCTYTRLVLKRTSRFLNRAALATHPHDSKVPLAPLEQQRARQRRRRRGRGDPRGREQRSRERDELPPEVLRGGVLLPAARRVVQLEPDEPDGVRTGARGGGGEGRRDRGQRGGDVRGIDAVANRRPEELQDERRRRRRGDLGEGLRKTDGRRGRKVSAGSVIGGRSVGGGEGASAEGRRGETIVDIRIGGRPRRTRRRRPCRGRGGRSRTCRDASRRPPRPPARSASRGSTPSFPRLSMTRRPPPGVCREPPRGFSKCSSAHWRARDRTCARASPRADAPRSAVGPARLPSAVLLRETRERRTLVSAGDHGGRAPASSTARPPS